MTELGDLDLWVYDFEVFACDWLLVAKEVRTGNICHWWNEDAEELIGEVETNPDRIWVGWNSSNYDRWIMKAILAGCEPEEVKEVNDFIIDGNQGWQHPHLVDSWASICDCDLKKDTQAGMSLKSIEGALYQSIIESEVDFHVAHRLSSEERDEVLFYCTNDVNATENILAMRSEYLETKLRLGERAGITPQKALSLTNAKLTAVVLGARRRKEVEDDERAYVLPDNLEKNYIPDEVVVFFKRLKDKTIPDEDLFTSKLNIAIQDCAITLGFGGIHGAIPHYAEDAAETRHIINVDVASYYPSLMVHNGYASRATDDPKAFEAIYHERLSAKSAGDKETANALKLIVNTAYGAMLNQYNDLYDPLMARSVCISGQLYLLELAEHVAEVNGVKIIQLNTDGLMLSLPSSSMSEAEQIFGEWQERTHFVLETDHISRIRQKDVSNYVMVATDGHVKCKGGWLTRGVSAAGAFKVSNNANVIARAVIEYLAHDTSIEQTVASARDIGDFQIIAKAGHKFQDCFQMIDGEQVPIQMCNRLFATLDETQGVLYKTPRKGGNPCKIAGCPPHSAIHNGPIATATEDALQLDRSWYVQEAVKQAKEFGSLTSNHATGETMTKADNVYAKLARARKLFAERHVQRSGVNEHHGFEYFELADIVPSQIEIFAEVGLLEIMTTETVGDGELDDGTKLTRQNLVATIVNAAAPEETIEFRIPWTTVPPIRTKDGRYVTNPLQQFGSEETYLRRYMKMLVLDVVVQDEVDADKPEPKVREEKREDDTKTTLDDEPPKVKVRKSKQKKGATSVAKAAKTAAESTSETPAAAAQVRGIKNAIKALKEQYPDADALKAAVRTIKKETTNLKDVSAAQASDILERLGQLAEELSAESEK